MSVRLLVKYRSASTRLVSLGSGGSRSVANATFSSSSPTRRGLATDKGSFRSCRYAIRSKTSTSNAGNTLKVVFGRRWAFGDTAIPKQCAYIRTGSGYRSEYGREMQAFLIVRCNGRPYAESWYRDVALDCGVPPLIYAL